MERQAGDFTTDGIEAAENDGIRRIVDNHLYASKGLQCPYVTTLATNDTSLDLLVLEVEDADGVLHCCLGSGTLYGLYNDFLGLLIGGNLRLFDNIHNAGSGIGLGLFGHHLYQLLLGFFGSHRGYLLQPFNTRIVDLLYLGLPLAKCLNLVV